MEWWRRKHRLTNEPLRPCGHNHTTPGHSTKKRKDWPQIIAARKAGSSARDICKKFGIHPVGLYKRLKAEGVPFRDNEQRERLLNRIKTWAARGWPRARIAAKVGLSHAALSAICREHGIKTVKRKLPGQRVSGGGGDD